MRKMVLVVCLLALGGVMLASATSPQKLVWTGPMNGEVRANVSFNTAPDTGWLGYFPSQISIGGLGARDTFLLATQFNPSDFHDQYGYIIGYPLWIKKAMAFFFEFPDNEWSDDKFKFFIYGDDGATKLHESSQQTAVRNDTSSTTLTPTIYELSDSIEITQGTFWIAIDQIDTEGHPMLIYNAGDFRMRSFVGTPGDWYPLDEAGLQYPGELLIAVFVNYTPTEGVEELSTTTPLTLNLSESPVRNQVEIRYSLSKPGPVSIDVFDISGRPLRRLVSQEIERGEHTVIWDGTNNQGWKVSNGTYFCRLSSGGSSVVKKIVWVK